MPYTASNQAPRAGMLSCFRGRQTLVQGDGCITRIPEFIEDTRDKRGAGHYHAGNDPARDGRAASGAV